MFPSVFSPAAFEGTFPAAFPGRVFTALVFRWYSLFRFAKAAPAPSMGVVVEGKRAGKKKNKRLLNLRRLSTIAPSSLKRALGECQNTPVPMYTFYFTSSRCDGVGRSAGGRRGEWWDTSLLATFLWSDCSRNFHQCSLGTNRRRLFVPRHKPFDCSIFRSTPAFRANELLHNSSARRDSFLQGRKIGVVTEPAKKNRDRKLAPSPAKRLALGRACISVVSDHGLSKDWFIFLRFYSRKGRSAK